MYFRHLFGTISLLSIIVSAFTDYSDFISAGEESEPIFTSLPTDQTAFSDDEFNPSLDQTASLFDELPSSSSSAPFTGFDVSPDSEITSLDLSSDDSFKLASCSTSEGLLPSALGKSRIRRAGASSSCNVPDEDTVLQSIQSGKFSLTCSLITAGRLLYAMVPSDRPEDSVYNPVVWQLISPMDFGFRLYHPTTLYRATLRKKKRLFSTSSISRPFIQILMLTLTL